MVISYHLTLENASLGSLKEMLEEKGLLVNKYGKQYVTYYGEEELAYLAEFPDERLPLMAQSIDLLDEEKLEWSDITGDTESLAFYVSQVLDKIPFKFIIDYRNMAGAYKVDTNERLLNGHFVDQEGEKCVGAISDISAGCVRLKETGDSIHVSVKTFRSRKVIRRTFPRKDFQKGILYLREGTHRAGLMIQEAIRDYALDEEYALMTEF